MGQAWPDWIHYEVSESAWDVSKSVKSRLGKGKPPTDLTGMPPFNPENGDFSLWPLNKNKPEIFVGSEAFDAVRYLQGVLKKTGVDVPVDGDFSPVLEQAVMAFQRARKLGVDGRVGKKTWPKVDAAALKAG